MADVAWQMQGGGGYPGGMAAAYATSRMVAGQNGAGHGMMPGMAMQQAGLYAHAQQLAGAMGMSMQGAQPQQTAVMNEIFGAVQAGDMQKVAHSLTSAIHNRVNLPHQFLAGVKSWMDVQRAAGAKAATPRPPAQPQPPQMPFQVSSMVPETALPAVGQPPQQGTKQTLAFADLHLRLERAIGSGDQEAMKKVLEEAASVAQKNLQGGVAPAAPVQPTRVADARSMILDPLAAASAKKPPPQPPVALPAQPQLPMQQAPPPPAPRPRTVNEVSSGQHVDVKVPWSSQSYPDAHSARPVDIKTPSQPSGPGDSFSAAYDDVHMDNDDVHMDNSQGAFSAPAPDAEVKDQMRLVLERQQDKQATLRKLAHLLREQVERVRKLAESEKDMFSIFNKGLNVRLIDEKSRQVMKSFRKLVMRAGRGPGLIHPTTAAESVPKLVQLAMQANAIDVASQLLALQQLILRRQKGETPFGMLSSNTPLLLACLIDQIVVAERRRGGWRSFEVKLGSIIHHLIFSGWVMGHTPGSQFLANLLLTWSRLGYFEPQQLEKCKKSLMLLIQYAPIEGVPDAPDKPRGTGWYGIVKRPAHARIGCEAINPVASLEVNPSPKASEVPGASEEPKEDEDIQVSARERAITKSEDVARPFINLSDATSEGIPPAKRQRSELGVGDGARLQG